MSEEDMRPVPLNWVPKNDTLKIEGEKWAILKTILV
jgi:hypothetical protein